MAMSVRFTDLRNGKVSSPETTTPKQAKYVYAYAAEVASAPFLVELLRDGVVIDFQTVGRPD